jgi:hypothetical protein
VRTEDLRSRAPTVFQSPKSYDKVASCIGNAALTRYRMKTLPAENGITFVTDYGGRSGMLIDLNRGPPVSASLYISHGPWLGLDTRLKEIVASCV